MIIVTMAMAMAMILTMAMEMAMAVMMIIIMIMIHLFRAWHFALGKWCMNGHITDIFARLKTTYKFGRVVCCQFGAVCISVACVYREY